MKPVIVLGFANDKDDYLPMISREGKNVFKSLLTHHDNNYIQVHKEESASVEDIFELFNRYRDRIAIFHFGGHAGGTHLQLETPKGEPQQAHAQGLANLMGQQKQLQLVFLNGCATLKQVKLLLTAGVKAVIATSVPVKDRTATEFAEQFYYALAGQVSVQAAFETAKSFITAKYGKSKEINWYSSKDVICEGEEKDANIQCPWGLYYNKNSPEVLQWKLPTSNRDSIIIRGSGISASSGVKVNTHLIETVFNEMTALGVERPIKMDWRAVRKTVIDGFPMPVGEQLRLLFYKNTIDEQRLKQLVITYQTTIELLCFTMLSQLWDAQIEDPKLAINEDYLTAFNSFFTLGPGSFLTFNYVKLIAALLGIFEENNIGCFIREFSTLKENFQTGSDFYEAHLFMEEIKKEILKDPVSEETINGMKADEIESLCVQGEAHLGTILKRLAFFVNYQLTTIKTIEVIKPRHKKATFNHNEVVLNRATEGVADEAAEFDTFTDNKSVIFLKNSEEVGRYLSLSPFIIDENALTGDEFSKLFFYSHREVMQGKECYVYKFIDNREETLTVLDEKYPQVKELMEDFKERTLCGVVT
ncbi:MAG: CHAT domain-containing protein [Candidatus Aminicenantes bacterium]|nr:CHAT domain-containing protein [Candidatus Aminicenantes bacterium]